MLLPEVLDYILDSLSMHKKLQESIIRDIVRRLVKSGILDITETTAYQAERLRASGIVYEDVLKIISEESKNLYADVKFAFDSALNEVFNYDDELILKSPYSKEKITNISPAMKNIWQAALNKTFTDANNLTKTIASTVQSSFIAACDLAHLQIASGSFSYTQAIANAIKQAAFDGVRVTYPSGASANVEYAVRRAVLTGVNQTASQIMKDKATELDHDLMQTTAHHGAREEHAVWQGQVVSLSGKSGYLTLDDVGYGSVTGIFGANCSHTWLLYFGYSPYTPEMLYDMKNKTVTYNGKEMSYYEATQKQRGYERQIKASKRQLVGLDEAMKNLPHDKALDVKSEFDYVSRKLKTQEARLKDYCKQTGLKRDKFREQAFVVETENCIKNFGKSTSQKAVKSAQKYYDTWRKSIGADDTPKTLAKYYDMKYNNTKEYTRLQKYIHVVEDGQVSPLLKYSRYKKECLEIEKNLIGLTTPNGITIKDYSAHFVARTLGKVGFTKKYQESGINITDLKDTLMNGKIGKTQYNDKGLSSFVIVGKNCMISVNPNNARLVQVNNKK